MNGQLSVSETQEILSLYVDKLEDGEDKIELIEMLQEVSHISKEHKEMFQKAILAQMVYYQQYYATKVPEMMARFEENMKKIDEARNNKNIWEYLNRLLELKGSTWKDCLFKIGANTKYASQITQGRWNLMRFRPEDLAQIAAWVGADPSEIMRLSYEELQKQGESLSDASHFRVKNERWENNDKDIKQQNIEKEDEKLAFMANLNVALDELLLD